MAQKVERTAPKIFSSMFGYVADHNTLEILKMLEGILFLRLKKGIPSLTRSITLGLTSIFFSLSGYCTSSLLTFPLLVQPRPCRGLKEGDVRGS